MKTSSTQQQKASSVPVPTLEGALSVIPQQQTGKIKIVYPYPKEPRIISPDHHHYKAIIKEINNWYFDGIMFIEPTYDAEFCVSLEDDND